MCYVYRIVGGNHGYVDKITRPVVCGCTLHPQSSFPHLASWRDNSARSLATEPCASIQRHLATSYSIT